MWRFTLEDELKSDDWLREESARMLVRELKTNICTPLAQSPSVSNSSCPSYS